MSEGWRNIHCQDSLCPIFSINNEFNSPSEERSFDTATAQWKLLKETRMITLLSNRTNEVQGHDDHIFWIVLLYISHRCNPEALCV